MPDRGVFKGEALQNFVNRAVNQRQWKSSTAYSPSWQTDLHSGEMVVFRTGNTGMAVRASSSVPGFSAVTINGHEYVDGGLTSPVPVRVAKTLGADFVIAVDVSAKPEFGRTTSSFEVLLQTFAIMQQSISRNEITDANVAIRPTLPDVRRTDFRIAISPSSRASRRSLQCCRNSGRSWPP